MFTSPTAMLNNTIMPDMLYRIGVTLSPDQEAPLLGKLKLVLGRRIARSLWFLLSPEEQRAVVVLSDYASRDAVQHWLEANVPGLPDLLRVEGLLLRLELLLKAHEIQCSGGERGIPDWLGHIESEAA
jgi:hypothetical protein